MVLIADADGPTSIAGVMGGARSEVEPGTTRVLMEAANWNGANIHRTSLKLGLRSEASTRFEKQLQPEQAMEAQARGHPADDRAVRRAAAAGHDRHRRRRAGARRRSACATRASAACSASRSRASAAPRSSRALEFETADAADGLDVTVPAFRRADVTREADLIEEVARLGALDKLPATLPSRHGASGRLTDAPAAAPPRRRRAGRPGAARDRRLELRRARAGRAAADRRPARGRARRTRCPPSSRGCAPRCSAPCSTSRGATARAAPAPSACSRPAPCTCR